MRLNIEIEIFRRHQLMRENMLRFPDLLISSVYYEIYDCYIIGEKKASLSGSPGLFHKSLEYGFHIRTP